MILNQYANSRFVVYGRLFRLFETTLATSTVLLTLIMISYFKFENYFLLFTSMWLLGASIATLNDSLDLVTDSISHPDRPIVSGKVSILQARILSSILLLFSFLFFYLINFRAILVAIVVLVISSTYSLTTKRVLFLKNFTVAFSAIFVILSLPWIFSIQFKPILINFSISIGMLLVGYEVLKDIRDIEGDRTASIKTIATNYGPKNATITALILFLSSCIIMAIGFALDTLIIEMWISIITAFFLLIPFWILYQDPNPSKSDISRYLVVGILSISLSLIAGIALNGEI